MLQIDRRTAVLGGLSTLASCGKAPAAEVVWRLGTNLPATHPLSARIIEAADLVYLQSNHRLLIEVYPAGQLGSDADMMSQVRAGAIHMLSMSGLITSSLMPLAALSGIGFAFADREQVFAAMDGEVGRLIQNGFLRVGLMTTPKVFENGFRQITTGARPINTPADLRNLKIRVPPGALWNSMFRSFGAAPTSINFNEVYSALQTHVVEGQENPLAVVDTAKLHEVQRYCAMTNHMWDGFWLLQNKDALEALPSHLRSLVQAEFSRAADRQRQDLATLATTLPLKLQEAGMSFTRPDPGGFRDVLRRAGFYRHWRERLGARAWGLLEDVVGELA